MKGLNWMCPQNRKIVSVEPNWAFYKLLIGLDQLNLLVCKTGAPYVCLCVLIEFKKMMNLCEFPRYTKKERVLWKKKGPFTFIQMEIKSLTCIGLWHDQTTLMGPLFLLYTIHTSLDDWKLDPRLHTRFFNTQSWGAQMCVWTENRKTTIYSHSLYPLIFLKLYYKIHPFCAKYRKSDTKTSA